MKISAGYVVVKGGKVLLGRPHGEKERWSIFKGNQDHGEHIIDTAARELKEESGIDITTLDLTVDQYSKLIHIYNLKKLDKQVYVYLLELGEGDLKGFKFKCSSKIEDIDAYEIEDYKWFDMGELEDVLFPSQQGLADKLRKIYKK